MLFISLQIRDFLTFQRSTVFKFSEEISAIVGPEGAGKNQFLYALQWLFAEKPSLKKPVWASKWELWQVPLVILTAKDIQGQEYRLQRKLTYGGKIEHRVNDHLMSAETFENYVNVFRSDLHFPKSASELTEMSNSLSENKVYLCNNIDTNLENETLAVHLTQLKELAAHNQCILLTNKKLTMRTANSICGITMKNFGESEIVEMRLS